MIDYQGIAIVISSASGAVAVVAGIAIQVATFRRLARVEKKTDVTHDLVNGQSEKLQTAIATGAFAEGKALGVQAERDNPMVPLK